LQEVDRVSQLVNRKGLARIRVNNAVAFHVEAFAGQVLEMRGMGEVHEDLVVKLAHMIDRLIERDVERLSPAHCLVKSDPDEKCRFSDAMPRDEDSDVSAAKSAVD